MALKTVLICLLGVGKRNCFLQDWETIFHISGIIISRPNTFLPTDSMSNSVCYTLFTWSAHVYAIGNLRFCTVGYFLSSTATSLHRFASGFIEVLLLIDPQAPLRLWLYNVAFDVNKDVKLKLVLNNFNDFFSFLLFILFY